MLTDEEKEALQSYVQSAAVKDAMEAFMAPCPIEHGGYTCGYCEAGQILVEELRRREAELIALKVRMEKLERVVSICRDIDAVSCAAPYPRNFKIEVEPGWVNDLQNAIAALDREPGKP